MMEIHSTQQLRDVLSKKQSLKNTVLQGIDLADAAEELCKRDLSDTVLLGCSIPQEMFLQFQAKGALIFPELSSLPYQACRPDLYTVEELFSNFDPKNPCSYTETFDGLVYSHWQETGRAEPNSIMETLARRLHDHAMTDALYDFLESLGKPKIVAIMGGHNMLRSDPDFLKMARLSRSLTREGYLLMSGGGPGAMEATHVGAYFAAYDDAVLDDAIAMLSGADSYRDFRWLAAAFDVRAKYPPKGDYLSLAIPTWLYGHEPPNAFATHIAKYFANSVREEGLVTLAKHGIIFSPGSAGTIQEIFQDATQNHYASLGDVSPMVFFNTDYWTNQKPVYPLLKQLAQGKDYDELLTIVDTEEDVVSFIKANPPKIIEGASWSFREAHCS